ncbi:MAG: DUF4388 domain-containing protein [Candidatus Obscuribacterales bacterium]
MLKKSGLLSQANRGPIPPDITELHQLLSQALERRGQNFQISWRSVDMMTTYTLNLASPLKGGEPRWQLTSELRGIRTPMFDYGSCDVLLVHNLMSAAVAELTTTGRMQSGIGNTIIRRDDTPGKMSDTIIQMQAATPPQGSGPSATQTQPGHGGANAGGAPATSSSTHFAPPTMPGAPQAAHANAASTMPTPPAQAGSQSAAVPPPAAPPTRPEPILPFPREGDIGSLPLDELLRKIVESRVTGKLEVRNKNATALVWVQDGSPVDATAGDAEGDEAIIELLTWRDGQYLFESRVLRNTHTVHQSIDALLSQSRQLSERTHYLKEAGMLFSSTLLPKRTNITDLEFVQRAGHQAPLNVEFMNKFYRMLDGKQTIEEMIRAFQLSRIQIITLIYHLLTNDLIKISNPAVKSKQFAVQPRVIDGAAIQSVMMSLRRADTGMFIYPAFLYFLEQEYFRCYRSRSPLSVIVFEMRMHAGNGNRQLLPGPAILDAVLRISQLKRHVDLLAHYDAYDYALLLPNTKANGSQIFANRLVKALTATPLGGELEPSKLALAMGCASIPEDFVDLSSLLGAADLAMAQAKAQNKPVVVYRDIKPITTN